MSFKEMENMMYKIEGEDLYLIGTSEHSMIGKFIDSINDEDTLPQTLTSYSPCFRKEVGAHGIEERGVYRIHQFEKQEMIVVCKPEAWKRCCMRKPANCLPQRGESSCFSCCSWPIPVSYTHLSCRTLRKRGLKQGMT